MTFPVASRMELRKWAVERALELARDGLLKADSIVDAAREFEQYVLESTDGEKPSEQSA